ncbi:AMP-binding protein [Verrucomicrobium sp. BvORR106]|uniref:AMP-binding protein n=1 Tax=Verrucomicrobium sp. BvORR106 TaxID=1403819 RepID=UPI00056F6F31|nr:AMP-binding protein [Verrucomicrobium sp. BvORR106]
MNHLSEPAWVPSEEFISSTNIAWLMQKAGAGSWEELHAWSVTHREAYWELAIERLGLTFQQPWERIADLSRGPEHPEWLPGAHFNIAESCLKDEPDALAILHQDEGGAMKRMTRGALAELAGRVAAGLARLGVGKGDRIALFLPMSAEAVAIYLGTIQAGCAVVGIADSFCPPEIAVRLSIAPVSVVFTQQSVLRGGKELPLYASVVAAATPRAVVLGATEALARTEDITWWDFLPEKGTSAFEQGVPSDAINILFSSGTTGEPKAIPWSQTTPIKCGADAHFHHDIRPGDVLVWPTNIGWMMGPWLIFASLLNRSAMALWQGAPVGAGFGRFVQESGATMLGVIPTLVKTWRKTDTFSGSNLSRIRAFSSTGECSNADDMRWLMAQAGGRPVIEYCGGTEIGGGYITGVVTRACIPGTFNAKALGGDFVILNEAGQETKAGEGEVYLLPPSIGLSLSLLNRDHHQSYYAGCPEGPQGEVLRRHGDQMKALSGGYWSAHGRADDTMNLSGIKVSSAEIERTLQSVAGVTETAAIAVAPGGGPDHLVIYVVGSGVLEADKTALQAAMQERIKHGLNPLFKIHDVVPIEALPRTASNKVMRRVLRDLYLSNL